MAMEAMASTFLSYWPTPSSLPQSSVRHSWVRMVAGAAPRRPLLAAAAGWMGYYMVLVDAAPSGITRPLVQILCDLNKRVPVTIVIPASRCASASDPVVPWYHANRMLSFYAPAAAAGVEECSCGGQRRGVQPRRPA